MTLIEFKKSLTSDKPPENLNAVLCALWYDAKNDWDEAHKIAQSVTATDGSWVHAYLHRKEGDLSNARYWYNRARRSAPSQSVTLDEEWTELASHFSDRA